jgi:hypothetical protein
MTRHSFFHAILSTERVVALAGVLAGCAGPTAEATVAAPNSARHGDGEVATVIALVNRHFETVNDTDDARRGASAQSLYTADCPFFEPDVVIRGSAAISRQFGGLHQKVPGARFSVRDAIDTHHGVARVRWALGRPGEPPLHIGEDLIFIVDGRIGRVYVFVDP